MPSLVGSEMCIRDRLRASNTQPALVVRIEGETEEELEKIKEEFMEVIEKFK